MFKAFPDYPAVNGFRKRRYFNKETNDYYWVFVNDKTNEELPVKLNSAREFKNGFCAVWLHGEKEWTFINEKGEAFEGRYEKCGDFEEGFAPVKPVGEKWGYVNEKGEETLPVYDFAFNFKNGKAKVIMGTEIKHINTKGQKVSYTKEDELLEKRQAVENMAFAK